MLDEVPKLELKEAKKVEEVKLEEYKEKNREYNAKSDVSEFL